MEISRGTKHSNSETNEKLLRRLKFEMTRHRSPARARLLLLGMINSVAVANVGSAMTPGKGLVS